MVRICESDFEQILSQARIAKGKMLCFVVVLLLVGVSNGFLGPGLYNAMVPPKRLVAVSSSRGDRESNIPKKSRLEGNQRDPTAEELAVMDEMITKLANAKAYELPNAVRRAFRVISSPRFFLRIAERTDMANDSMEKEKLAILASNLVSTLEMVVETTEETLDERAREVEKVVKVAAEPETGEFLVPLLPSQVSEMRIALESLEPSSLDEGFLSTVDAWMDKSYRDGMDGMVSILQKVLQMYSGVQILRARQNLGLDKSETSPVTELFELLLKVDSDLWESEVRKGVKEVSTNELVAEIQRNMENIVLGLENGSMAQRVQAEYLRELLARVEAVQRTTF